MAKKLPITKDQVFNLARIGATNYEISVILKCSEATITNRFQKELEQGRANMKLNLRQAQMKVATQTENPTMLIFLGKNYLEQADTQNLNVIKGIDVDDGKEKLLEALEELKSKHSKAKTEPKE